MAPPLAVGPVRQLPTPLRSLQCPVAPRLRLSVKKKVPSVSSNGKAVFAKYGAGSRNGGRGPMHTSPSGEHGRHMLGRA